MKKPRKLHHEGSHIEHRAKEYAPPGDALDAIQKGFRAMRDAGIPLPPETAAWIDSCDSVKARFPKKPHRS